MEDLTNPTISRLAIEELLKQCDQRGIKLSATEACLRYRCPAGVLTTDLRSALAANRTEIIRRLNSGSAAVPAQPPIKTAVLPTRRDWPPEIGALADFVQLLTPDDLPYPPFKLWTWCVVVDRTRFLATMQVDARIGPRNPRARFGALQADLLQLRNLLLDR
jgi:hypothetical protein